MRTFRTMHMTWRCWALAGAALTGTALAQAQTQNAAPASAPATATAHAKGSSAHPSLDLHAPPLNHIIPRAQLNYILAVDDSDADDVTEVSVKSTRYVERVPGVPGNQLQAIPWAIVHPLQAWRIFTPLVEEP